LVSEDEFRTFISMLQFQDGVVRLGTDRYCLAEARWFAELQQDIERIVGPDGAFVLMDEAAKSGSRPDDDSSYHAFFSGMSFEQRVELALKFSVIQGWGPMEITEISANPPRVVIKATNPYHQDLYQGKADGPRCYPLSGMASLIESHARLDGIDVTLKVAETKCKAKGDPYCEYVFEPEDKEE
jgi:hypothetical protein